MDVGWRVLRLDWIPLAARHGRPSASRSRAHRVLGRALEAASWICNAGAGAPAAVDQRRRPAARRFDDRPREHRVAEGDRGKRRRARRALHQTCGFWWRERAAFPYSPRMKILVHALTALAVAAILAPVAGAQWEKRTSPAVPRLPNGQ